MNHHLFIQSNHISLRPFTMEDQAELLCLIAQPEITNVLPEWKMTVEQLEGFLQFVIGSYEQFDPGDVRVMLAVVHNVDQRVIGWCGVFPNDMLDASDREVAYAISRDHRSKGYMTEAVRAISRHLFEHTSLERIVGIVKPFNMASRKVLEHAGFRLVSRRRLADGADYEYFELIGKESGQTGNDQPPALVRLRRAQMEDAAMLTETCIRAFDQAMKEWSKGPDDLDPNLCPPGYSSVHMHRYVIREWDYFTVELGNYMIGGVSVQVLGCGYARLDKIFIDPAWQGRGVGAQVVRLIEAAYPEVAVWRLETSGRQPNNHHFYEKMGYERLYSSKDEYGYEKRLHHSVQKPILDKGSVEFIQAHLEEGRISSSNLSRLRVTDCNLSGSRFTNLNMTDMLLADLRLSGSVVEWSALDGIHFRDTHLGAERRPMQWERCDLAGTVFRACDLSGVQLNGCSVKGMKIDGVAVEDLLAAYERCKSGEKND